MAALSRLARLARCVLVALAVCIVAATPVDASASTAPPMAGGSIGLRLLDEPASAGNDPRARIYIVDHLAPGAVIRRHIEVSNTTVASERVTLYPAAAHIEQGLFLGAVGHTPNDLSTWTSVDSDTSDVPAGGFVTAVVTIAVPADAAPGEQYGVVWAEGRKAPTASGVTQVNRVGIRLYVSVGPGGPPAVDFTIESLTAQRSPDGRPAVLAAVHNTGGRALDMNGTLQLLGGPGGLSAGPFPATLGTTLAIGDTELVTIALDARLPAGPWDARITLRSGLVERTAQAMITFPDMGASAAVKTTSGPPRWPRLVIIAFIVLLLAIAGLLVVHGIHGHHPVAKARRRTASDRTHRGRGKPAPV